MPRKAGRAGRSHFCRPVPPQHPACPPQGFGERRGPWTAPSSGSREQGLPVHTAGRTVDVSPWTRPPQEPGDRFSASPDPSLPTVHPVGSPTKPLMGRGAGKSRGQLSVKCCAQKSSCRPSRPRAGMNSSGTDPWPFFFRSRSNTCKTQTDDTPVPRGPCTPATQAPGSPQPSPRML